MDLLFYNAFASFASSTSGALCQVEKVVLFFLAKQGELASRLLDARREFNDGKTGETNICFGATAKEMEEEWVSDSPISRYGDSPARSLRFVYLSIGGEIDELMRFLQLNGKASRTIPLRTENMALSGERFGPVILQ